MATLFSSAWWIPPCCGTGAGELGATVSVIDCKVWGTKGCMEREGRGHRCYTTINRRVVVLKTRALVSDNVAVTHSSVVFQTLAVLTPYFSRPRTRFFFFPGCFVIKKK